MSEFNQDQKSQQFRLAVKEQAGPNFPMAGPMDSRDFLPIAEGDVPLEPYSLDVITFSSVPAVGELSLEYLTTTGFEGLDGLPPAARQTVFLPVVCKPVPAAAAKIIQGYPALPCIAPQPSGSPAIHMNLLCPRLVLGPKPTAPEPVVVVKVSPVPTITVRPPSAPAAVPEKPVTAKNRPAMTARDRSALAVERSEPETPPAPQLKPGLSTFSMQQMEPSAIGKFWTAASTPMKSGAIVAAALLIVTCGYFLFRPTVSTEASGTPSNPATAGQSAAPGMLIGGGGWTTNWGSEVSVNKGKQISLFRPSMSMPDYRFEFRGQIEKKALGWIFRAANPTNYYVCKLEIVKPGLNPVLALIKYSVINGQEGTHTQVMMPNDFKMDTVYRVRLDVRGNKFTTYVQDKLVDYWTDDRVKTGGTGFYTERGEQARIGSSQISYPGN